VIGLALVVVFVQGLVVFHRLNIGLGMVFKDVVNFKLATAALGFASTAITVDTLLVSLLVELIGIMVMGAMFAVALLLGSSWGWGGGLLVVLCCQ